MNRELDVLTILLLNPCLTADEAAREAAALRQAAVVVAETREARPRRTRKALGAAPAPTEDRPAVGF